VEVVGGRHHVVDVKSGAGVMDEDAF